MSLPPPATPAGPAPDLAVEGGSLRERLLPLEGPRGLRKLGGGDPGYVRLRGDELTIAQPDVLLEPIHMRGGLVRAASVDRGLSSSEHGRFPVLHRMANGKALPREQGIEGWLWTTRQGSVFPLLSSRSDDAPNLALLFVKQLDEADVDRWFRPVWLRALAERSALGQPAVMGLLLCVERPGEAETAFRDFGVLRDLTDREVPPTHRRHLPTDKPANPSIAATGDDRRAQTSVAPPGF